MMKKLARRNGHILLSAFYWIVWALMPTVRGASFKDEAVLTLAMAAVVIGAIVHTYLALDAVPRRRPRSRRPAVRAR